VRNLISGASEAHSPTLNQAERGGTLGVLEWGTRQTVTADTTRDLSEARPNAEV
jgi:hypothetical protein